MRKALIIGIDYYPHLGHLLGCSNDARAIQKVLERHSNGSSNFVTPRVMIGTGPAEFVKRFDLKDAVGDLFDGDPEIALLYFAGHGYLDDIGGYLCASDSERGDDGLSLSDLMKIANNSAAQNKVIVLDSCHSGAAGDDSPSERVAKIKEGMTILTASTATQRAMEGNGSGVFTKFFVDALEGAAANLVGDVTPGSVYAHIDRSLGPWGQRPVFKTNIKSFVSLRETEPPILLAELHALPRYFPTPDFQFQLDPSYEPERSAEQLSNPDVPPPDRAKNDVFAVLQNYVSVNLVKPVGAKHMWHAAMQSKSCELTLLGIHYRELVERELI